MIPDSPTRSANIAYRNAIIIAAINTNSGYFSAMADLSKAIRAGLTNRIPMYPNIAINAPALKMTITRPAKENVPPTRSSVMARNSRLRTSSITAAPMMAFAAVVCSLPISLRTLAVIAILVAVMAVPTKRELANEYPDSSERRNTPAQGITTPRAAIAAYPGLTISRILNSNPITNRRMMAPNAAILWIKSV